MNHTSSEAELQELDAYKSLFDRVERQPLTPEQRAACVSSARNTLVLAGAGTGKTSTLAGRAAYLQASGKARPEQILLLAFAREAANEMDSRIASRQTQQDKSVEARTFHALGLSIVQEVEQTTIALSELSDEAVLCCPGLMPMKPNLVFAPVFRKKKITRPIWASRFSGRITMITPGI